MWPNPQDSIDLVTFTEEILNGKLHFLSGEDASAEVLQIAMQGLNKLFMVHLFR